MAITRLEGDVNVTGNLSANTLSLPNNAVDNDAVSSDANKRIAATKQEHQHEIHFEIDHGVEVSAIKRSLHTVKGVGGTIVSVDVVSPLAPIGPGDKQLTVDILKSNQAAPSLVSVLTGVVTITNSELNFEVVAGTIDAAQATVADGDTLTIDVAVSGTSGSQAEGLIVTLTIREDPE